MRVSLETTVDGLRTQRDSFLKENGFEGDTRCASLFCQMIQALPQDQDWFDADIMASSIRKALANSAAFYLMYPERLVKDLAEQAEYEARQKADSEVVQEARE